MPGQTKISTANWPRPTLQGLSPEATASYHRRRIAVELVEGGASIRRAAIRSGIGKSALQKLLNRCQRAAPDGRQWGWFGLLPNLRISYRRRLPSVENRVVRGLGGASGLFQAVLTLHPEATKFLKDLAFHRQSLIKEVHPTWRTVHRQWLDKLLELGASPSDYPFDKVDCAYTSLVRYCNGLVNTDELRWVIARYGKNAGRGLTPSRGIPSVLTVLRPYQEFHLDYSKFDALGIIEIDRHWGEPLQIVVRRIWWGVVADSWLDGPMGGFISLEFEPTADCFLQTLENSIFPMPLSERLRSLTVTADGKVFPNQIFPEVAFQACDLIKVDNGKANLAIDSICNALDVLGRAVAFGPFGAWFTHMTVEKLNQKVQSHGPQRLPSSLGAGPQDPIKANSPGAEAIKYQIKLTVLEDIYFSTLRAVGETQNGGRLYTAPYANLKAAIENPQSSFLPAPLPLDTQTNSYLHWHVETLRVGGRIESSKVRRGKPERPHVYFLRGRWTNSELSARWDLIGKDVLLYVHRLDISLNRLVDPRTHIELGQMTPPMKWRGFIYAYRDALLIIKRGRQQREETLPVDPVLETLHALEDEMAKKPDSAKASNSAQRHARALANRQRAPDNPERESATHAATGAGEISDFKLPEPPLRTRAYRRTQ